MARLMPIIPELNTFDPAILARVAIDATYAPHLKRQAQDIRVFMEDEQLVLDPLLDYQSIFGLSDEVKERLARVRPTTIGAAKRMEGMTPTSFVALLRFAKKAHGRATRMAEAQTEEVTDQALPVALS
ncbi:hypothetical protein EIP86_005794 [Pleurotus ostreatoroseus]|nr:hypothetical protein EIP86_005794 [Pleurotus ostreatoroseus]